ncbi:hypothetical protein CAEBREN_13245 [Caenorhabditis brenneri]|uniref:Uncharacterized protein n=1 Tax=Caenorhabditis brenneri TaxID=135651 RepID=G0PCY5_CAEBE|nr:hypothetical protein CAEBREN_13245 [Caenorhabditis brenneri]
MGCEKKLPKGATTFPLGNGLQVVSYESGKVSVVPIASRGLPTDKTTIKEYKKIREKQGEIATKNLERKLKKDKVPIEVPKHLEKEKAKIEEAAALATEELDYNEDINIPHEYHNEITVAPWTKAVLEKEPTEGWKLPSDNIDDIPLYDRAKWESGDYSPYVIRYNIGKQYEKLAKKDAEEKSNKGNKKPKQAAKKKKPKDTLSASESTKSVSSSTLKATASNPKTAVLQDDSDKEIDEAIAEMDELLSRL